jgi:septum formation protein
MTVTSARGVWIDERPLILASRSEARHSLLLSCGIEAELCPADLDERSFEGAAAARGALPAVIARLLAGEKARSVALARRGRYVLGADQVLALDDRRFAKAWNRDEAHTRLVQLSGRCHLLISALAVARDGEVLYEGIAFATMRMRSLEPDEIETYLDLIGEEALESVGAYRIEGLGRLLFDRIEADQSVILGLPLSGLLTFLRSAQLIRL